VASFGRLTLVLGWLWGCAAEPAPEVWFGACVELSPAGRCKVSKGAPLVVWVSETPEVGAVEVDGAVVEAARSVVDGGARLEIPVEGARSVRVELGQGRGAWALALGGEEVGPAGSEEVRDAYKSANSTGDQFAMFDAAADAERVYRAAGWERDATMWGVRATQAALKFREVEDEVLAERAAEVSDASLRAARSYTRALVFGRRGDVRRATAQLDETMVVARRALPAGWVDAVRYEVARLMVAAASAEEGRRVLHDLLGDPLAPRVEERADCSSVGRHYKELWLFYELDVRDPRRDRRRERIGAVADELQQVLKDFHDLGPCPSSLVVGEELRLNLALAKVALAETEDATALLTELEVPPSKLHLLAWKEVALAEISSMSERAPAAVEHWERARRYAAQMGDLEMEWRTLDGLAAVSVAAGEVEAGLAGWEEADRAFRRHGLMVSLQGGRAEFLSRRARSVATRVEALLALGRAAQAFEVVRTFRAQFLSSMLSVNRLAAADQEVRQRWLALARDLEDLARSRSELIRELDGAPADARAGYQAQLDEKRAEAERSLDEGLTNFSVDSGRAWREPDPGEVLVTWLASEVGWTVLARSDSAVAVASVVGDWSAVTEWPAELDSLFEHSHRVTLLTSGEAALGDVHLLPWRGAPLIREREVQWAIDVPSAPRARASGATSALVVVDPLLNLEQARAEGQQVVEALRARGVVAEVLKGRDATREAVWAGLQRGPSLVHFAGHGEVPDDPWSARLRLASGALELSDLLAMSAAPRVVVLAGCETAKTGEALVATLGLAQAFVHAGTDAAVATARPVDDGLARAFSEAFYASAPLERGVELAFRSAVGSLMQSHPKGDYGAFRLVVP
jgi:hypothetical protein